MRLKITARASQKKFGHGKKIDMASVPILCTVDHILMPIHIKSRWHWVLGVFTVKDKCIYVYDSKRSAANDKTVREVVASYAEIIPIYLEKTEFYKKKRGVDWFSDAYFGKDLAAPLEIEIVNSLPQQKTADCGAFVATFGEYFIMEKSFPKLAKDFDIQTIRSRYAVSFWEYAMAKKKLGNAISESKDTGRIYGKRGYKGEDDGKTKQRKKK